MFLLLGLTLSYLTFCMHRNFYHLHIGKSPICWKSKKQQTICRSSSENKTLISGESSSTIGMRNKSRNRHQIIQETRYKKDILNI